MAFVKRFFKPIKTILNQILPQRKAEMRPICRLNQKTFKIWNGITRFLENSDYRINLCIRLRKKFHDEAGIPSFSATANYLQDYRDAKSCGNLAGIYRESIGNPSVIHRKSSGNPSVTFLKSVTAQETES
ncbi:MAG: hypothetical protein LBF40_06780 [Deltaproteobacteria bacterium]|jgi:hypothetical protein|nr:hypothetical protein [Deltaproteobacteria bacterium]